MSCVWYLVSLLTGDVERVLQLLGETGVHFDQLVQVEKDLLQLLFCEKARRLDWLVELLRCQKMTVISGTPI